MKITLRKIKYRWKVAPTWIKTIDILCWVSLLFVIVSW